MLPLKCPKCGYVWIYTGSSRSRIGCPKCSRVILGQKIGLAELTVEQYADHCGEQELKIFEQRLVILSENISILQELEREAQAHG
jgi:ribosomal protein S27E